MNKTRKFYIVTVISPNYTYILAPALSPCQKQFVNQCQFLYQIYNASTLSIAFHLPKK